MVGLVLIDVGWTMIGLLGITEDGSEEVAKVEDGIEDDGSDTVDDADEDADAAELEVTSVGDEDDEVENATELLLLTRRLMFKGRWIRGSATGISLSVFGINILFISSGGAGASDI